MPYSINWIEKKIMNGEKIRVLKETVLKIRLWHSLAETQTNQQE
jgi:hypothetical protein